MTRPVDTTSHCHGHHDQPPVHEKSLFNEVMWLAQKICLVALGVFAANTDQHLFIPSFFFGLAVGVYQYMQNPLCNSQQHQHSAGCGQDFLEQQTGVRLPAPLLLAVTVATAAHHIDHHPPVYVPITGIYIGAWVGKSGMEGGSLLFRKWSQYQGNLVTA